jgi:hypothetical protein
MQNSSNKLIKIERFAQVSDYLYFCKQVDIREHERKEKNDSTYYHNNKGFISGSKEKLSILWNRFDHDREWAFQ